MCVRVHCSKAVTEPWDASRGVITIPSQLGPAYALRAVRAVLAELHVEQPTVGAVCWCGAPVPVMPVRVPAQRSDSEVMLRGA